MVSEELILLFMQFLFLLLGMGYHLVLVLGEMSQARGCVVSPFLFIKERPYKFAGAFIGSIVGFAILHSMGELSLLTAFGAGVMANDSADRVAKMTQRRMIGGD